jgi:hypothetical protein
LRKAVLFVPPIGTISGTNEAAVASFLPVGTWDTPLAADPPFLKTKLSNRTRTIRAILSSKKIESRHFALTIVITQVPVTGDDP